MNGAVTAVNVRVLVFLYSDQLGFSEQQQNYKRRQVDQVAFFWGSSLQLTINLLLNELFQ